MIKVEDYINLAYKVAARFYSKNEDKSIDEINSEALFALVKAANRFDERKGVKFSTFAIVTIEYEIKNSFYRDKSKFRRRVIEGKDVYERIYTDSLDREINLAEGVKLIDCFIGEFNIDKYSENIDLKIAINKLNMYQKNILKMIYFDEKTQKETAKFWGVHESTISKEKKKIFSLLKKSLIA